MPEEKDLEILHPEREATIAGRQIVMRELTFLQGLRLEASAAPLVRDLVAASKGTPELGDLRAIFGAHAEATVLMMAEAAQVEAQWIQGLSNVDGQTLLLMFWTANWRFFIERLLMDQMAERAKSELDSPSSIPSSSEPGSDAAIAT